MRRLIGVLCAAGVVCWCAWTAGAGDFEIGLSAEEASGVARQAEPISGGVPLPKGMFRKGQAFALLKEGGGELPCQALPLIVRKDGSLRWVLVDFQDDLAAGATNRYVLRAVAGPGAKPASPVRVTETAGAVTVDTGKITFTISRTKPFGLFSSVAVDGRPVVTGGQVRCREHFTGASYTAGPPDSVEVEYRGPMRATVTVRGGFVGDARGRITYVARITAWAGASSVHLKYALCNSSEKRYCFRLIEDSTIALTLAGAPTGSILGADKPLAAGVDAWVAQALKPSAAGAAKASDGASEVWTGREAQGWIAARTAGGTVFATDLYFAADPARKLAMKDGSLLLSGIIERWRNEKKDRRGNEIGRPYADTFRVLYDCSHLSSQYVIDFAAPAEPTELARMAKAGLERTWLLATPEAYLHGDAIFSGHFGTQADEMACYDTWGWKYDRKDVPTKPHRTYPRFFRGIDNHFDPEEDVVDHLVMMYMRTGKRAYWKHLRSWGNYWTDLCAWRTDGWRWKDGGVWKRTGPKGSAPQRPEDPVTGIRNIMPLGDGGPDGRTFTIKRSGSRKLPLALSPGFVADTYILGIYKGCYCHNWSAGLFHLFCLTGDRDVMEAAIDRAEQGFDQETRAFGRKPGDGRGFGRSFTRTFMNVQAATMFFPEDAFFIRAREKVAAVYLERKVREPRGLVNAAGRLQNGIQGGLTRSVGKQGVAAMKALGYTVDERTGLMTDPKTGHTWYIISQPATWQNAPLSRAMERYYLDTGSEDALDWTIAYGQAVARVLYQRHGNFDYSRFLVDFPRRGVAKDYGSWVTDPVTNPWAEGPTINSFLARFHPDACARAYDLCGEPFLKQRAHDLLFGGTHRGYNAPKMKPLDRVGMWMNYYSDHDGQIDFMLRTFYIWAQPRRDQRPPRAVADLKVTVQGEKATVAFTAPADEGGRVARYQVKCSDKPIVDYVTFLDLYNTFEDGKHCNWWMAANLQGEPTPAAAGTRERFVVTGVPKGARYFAVRSFDDSSNRSVLGNVIEVGRPGT